MNAITAKATSSPAGDRLVGVTGPRAVRTRSAPTHRGWRAVGWFGLLLAVIGFADLSLYLYRPAFGSPEWEFGTMAAMMASLPLPSIGLAAIAAAVLVTGSRTTTVVTAIALLVLGLLVGVAYTVFLLRLPLALQATAGPQGVTIYRSIARTTIMGVGFGSAYLIAGIVLFRYLPQRRNA